MPQKTDKNHPEGNINENDFVPKGPKDSKDRKDRKRNSAEEKEALNKKKNEEDN